ncbi:basic amino acid ABC transporter substrate-binding protein [Halorubrum sp. AJ67]|uniref:basic amino acid ABC transporter substrate-binding protein n=1 Tax=Halorubrum sp. AJ67 TaxID=1173487 RepID=UPI00064E6387|nr:basic amino acid ABC transporter substrate-binding protein [Halorubrum sp. AJ67]
MDEDSFVKRRQYLTAVGAAGLAATAGCSGGGSDGGDGSDGEDGMDGDDGSDGDDGTDGDDGSDGDDGETETVTIGSDIPYPPFEYRNEAGDLIGFDVEIAEAVFADQLGLDYEFQETSFDGIIPSLNNANFRVIMSAMTINDTRAESVDFSDPYFTAYQTVIVLEADDISSREDLRGTTVGVQRGTTGEAAAEDLQEEFDGELTIESYDQINGAFDALLNNQVSAVINDNTVSAEFVAETDGVVFLEGDGVAADRDDAPPYLTLTIEEYGIAFRQDDDEFRQEVNDALAAIREDGTYDEIYNEYFEG